MAEFNEVMKQIKRICKANYYKCTDCPMTTQSFCQMSAFDMEGFEAIENIVTAWAAEHPVVYPTWEMYLAERMTADMRDGKTHNPQSVEEYMRRTRIPADIAEKLGIEPAEV